MQQWAAMVIIIEHNSRLTHGFAFIIIDEMIFLFLLLFGGAKPHQNVKFWLGY